jgi:photosystem II stability/assembly factor-like uncharacterized protein
MAATLQATATTLLVGTRKGAFLLNSRDRSDWDLSEPIFLGHIIYHMVADPRDPSVVLMAAKTGHLGPTVFHSKNGGKEWKEATTPPAFPKAPEGEKGRAVENVFWLTPGHESEPGVWYAGTAPPGLFRSEDNGENWEPITGFNDNTAYGAWTESGATPGGQFLHSILIDPRNPDHMYLGISVGGVFESLDRGKSWTPLNKGCAADFMPDPNAEYGHDPHCVVLHPLSPDRLYQQNHCGIYRMDRPSNEWVRIGKNMPAEVGDIGFPIVMHPRDPNRVWVFPMDGTEVWPRTSPGGKPATFATRDAGETWTRQDGGLPPANAYFTVKRQAMAADSNDPVGLYFGTTGGEVWASTDEGASWSCIARYLPEIYSITVPPAAK